MQRGATLEPWIFASLGEHFKPELKILSVRIRVGQHCTDTNRRRRARKEQRETRCPNKCSHLFLGSGRRQNETGTDTDRPSNIKTLQERACDEKRSQERVWMVREG